MEDFTSCRCPECGGVSHPESGCAMSPNWVLCFNCAQRFDVWVRRRVNSRPPARRGGANAPNFFDHINVVSPPITVQSTS